MVTNPSVISGLATFESTYGAGLFNATIIETFNRNQIIPQHRDYMEKMGIVKHALLNPDEKIVAKAAPSSLPALSETGLAEVGTKTFTPAKSPVTRGVGRVFQKSKKFGDWLKIAKGIEGATDQMEVELMKIAEDTQDLTYGYYSAVADDMVQLLALGFSVTTAGGPGSATPKGLSLFNASHTYGVGTATSGTFSNVVTGAAYTDVNTGVTQLQDALDKLKNARDENGQYIEQSSVYRLMVSRNKAAFWSKVLNLGSDGLKSSFSGLASNANQNNFFFFKGNNVELVVLDRLGQPDPYRGGNIGTNEMFFVSNHDKLVQSKSLKYFETTPFTITQWTAMDTDLFNVKGRGDFGVDHFGAELYIVGSTGSV